jgi:hypothetical protein
MKIAVILALPALLLFLTACKKDIHGCMDPEADNYSMLATKDDGSCFYEVSGVKSTTVTISNWTQASNDWATTIPYGEITTEVVESGAVISYINSGTNVWKALPLTIYQSIDYSTTIEVSLTVGQIIVYWKNSDGTLPANPGERVFKITTVL